MTQAQYTPGPWMYRKQLNGILEFFGEGGNRVILSTARLINQEANARLIAAAPELLEALQMAVDVPELQGGLWEELARAAIAKATAQQYAPQPTQTKP